MEEKILQQNKKKEKINHQLEYLDHNKVKDAISIDDIVLFDPKYYSQNLFWQTNKISEQKVYAIISKYLSTMDKNNIKTLCSQFGKNLVKSVLKDKYKKMYAKGYISTSGMDIPLNGKYDQNEMYKQLMKIINDC
jgi:uncharacterized protein YaaW (UPF0174 family)